MVFIKNYCRRVHIFAGRTWMTPISDFIQLGVTSRLVIILIPYNRKFNIDIQLFLEIRPHAIDHKIDRFIDLKQNGSKFETGALCSLIPFSRL